MSRRLACPALVHAQLIVSSSWAGLRLAGYQDDGDGGRLELRLCDLCRSTVSRPALQLAPEARARRAEHPRDIDQQPHDDRQLREDRR